MKFTVEIIVPDELLELLGKLKLTTKEPPEFGPPRALQTTIDCYHCGETMRRGARAKFADVGGKPRAFHVNRCPRKFLAEWSE